MGADLTAITEALASRLSATRDLALPKAEAFVAEHVVPLIAEREAKAFREGAEWLAERIDSRIVEARREGAAEALAKVSGDLHREAVRVDREIDRLRASAVSGEPNE